MEAEKIIISKGDKKKRPPEGAKIIEDKITIETEEIENGYLIIKRHEVKYKEKGKEYHDYCYYDEKYYSEEDPLEIKVTDKSLADAFKD